jgi:hypothetical protein
MPAKKAKPKPPNDWEVLADLVQKYADAQEAESWKGGGDPNDIEVLELRLKLARVEMESHVAKMRRERDEG